MKHSFGHRRLPGKKRRRRRRAQQLPTWYNAVPNHKFFSFDLALGATVPGALCFLRGIFESLFFERVNHGTDAACGSYGSRL